MKIKRLRTKKEKKLKRLDVIIVLICLVVSNILILKSTESYFSDIIDLIKLFKELNVPFDKCIMVYTILGILYITSIIQKSKWIICIYLAFRISRMKNIKENQKYEVINNIDYYRETFKEITPAEISLVTDLEIEYKKDMVASILDLYQKGWIEFEDNTIIIKQNEKIHTLKRSYIKLLKMIEDNDFSIKSVKEWEEVSIEEAIEDNLIQKFNSNKKNKFWLSKIISKFFIIIFVLSLIFLIKFIANNYENVELQIEKFQTYGLNEGISEIRFLKENKEVMTEYLDFISLVTRVYIYIVGVVISMVVLTVIPIYRFSTRMFERKNENKKFTRTKLGKILVEQFVGIKKYIHDYSLLSGKEKDAIVLWNEFLVYAIVLEENEKIIENISKYKNINNILNKILEIVII